MSQTSLPVWLKEEDVEPLKPNSTTNNSNNYNQVPTTASDSYSTTTSNTATEPSTKIQLIHWTMKVVLMTLCILMFVTAILGIGI